MISGLGNMFDDTDRPRPDHSLGHFRPVSATETRLSAFRRNPALDHRPARPPDPGPQARAAESQEAPSAYLRQVYFDIVSPLPQAMRLVYDLAGPDRLFFGSDHPWVDPKLIMERPRSVGLQGRVRKRSFSHNARDLFRLSAV